MKPSTNLTTKTATNEVATELRSAYNLNAVPRLIADWNLNRYCTPTASNTPSEDDAGFDIESFPIESIYEPLRPTKGLIKAKIGEAIVSSKYRDETQTRFYIGSPDDKYKYWTSPYQTDGTGTFPLHTDSVTTVRPTVTYDRVLNANKIIIRIENTWASPKNYSVSVQKTAGGNFSQVAGANPAMDLSTGVLTLYFNGSAWVTTRPDVLVTTPVAGIRLQVDSLKGGYNKDGTPLTYKKARRNTSDMPNYGTLDDFTTDGTYSSFSLISIEPHFEDDLTNRLMTVNDEFDIADSSPLYPIGVITSNTASITLSNDDGIFNKENTSSPYYGLLEPNAKFNLEYIYTIGSTKHSVQQFVMYSGEWEQGDGEVSLSLEDASKFLKDIKPNQIMYRDIPVTEAIWRVLDSVGFNAYKIQRDDRTIDNVIPVFWTTGQETVWEVLQQLAEATQTAIYIDQSGFIQVRTREAAFRDTAVADWNLNGVTSGSNLEDIITLNESSTYEANTINVTYKTTTWKKTTQGNPAMSLIWQPEEDSVVVRSSPLVRDVTDTSNYLFLDQSEVKIWPFKSKVQLDGEIIQYEGKHYVYYTLVSGTPTRNYAIVKDSDELAKWDAKSPVSQRSKNHFTGGLKITERGVWNTNQINHTVDINNYTTKQEVRASGTTTQSNNARGLKFNRKNSTITIETPSAMKDGNDTYWVSRGSSSASGYNAYGTRLRFNKNPSYTTQRAGIVIKQSGSTEDGYYIEMCTTNSLDAKTRQNRNEITLYSKKAGKYTVISKGTPIAVAMDEWYDLDIYFSTGTQDTISVWINGQKVIKATTASATKQSDSGKFSMYARGKTSVDFEYVYGIARTVTEPLDNYGFYDLKYGGIRGNQWQDEYVWETKTRWVRIKKKKWKKESYRHNQYLFDEFGTYVHEVREFDVKFDPSPVQYSYLFSTNEWAAATVEYISTPFGAKFVVTNTSRDHAVLKGEDSLTYGGTDKAVNQVFCVLGQDLVYADDAIVSRKNSAAIRSRGEIDVELSSNWIQSRGMARELAVWMSKHWSEGLDELTIEMIGNPLIEVADVVDINYPSKSMTPSTHRYFVTGAVNEFDQGLSTTLTLRRINTASDAALN